jgi:GTP-binding protein
MFVDEARIYLEAGRGGDGAVAFRREKYVPRGGPAGGDGGRGGDIVFVVDPGLTTLMDFRHQTHYRAENGQPGGNNNRAGRQGRDLEIRVPPGTLVLTEEGRLLADLTVPGERRVIARGGRGGRGNARFRSSVHRVPRIAERGLPGEARWVRLELRLLADVGLVGFPNVGKSTLISRMSEARPRIADYPFTTLVPNLGVVTGYGDPFVVADVPGLIEGAHRGLGLGHDFLKHLKRTRLLVHLVDVSPLSGRDPLTDYRIVRHELAAFSPRLAGRMEIVAATKLDVPGAEDRFRQLRQALGREVYGISAVSGLGLDALGWAMRQALDQLPVEPPEEVPAPIVPPPLGYRVERVDDGFRVVGDVEERAQMTRFGHFEDEAYLAEYLRRRGVVDALRRAGVQEGDRVAIGPGALVWVGDGLMPAVSREAAESRARRGTP